MTNETEHVDAAATAHGLEINQFVFNEKMPLERYRSALGQPTRTIDAGPPAPLGHRNNQIHLFDAIGIYLTEHHASRLIESVNFVFDLEESPFPIGRPFAGGLTLDRQTIRIDMQECDLDQRRLNRDLPGEFILKLGSCWVAIFTKQRRSFVGRSRLARYVIRVSVCF